MRHLIAISISLLCGPSVAQAGFSHPTEQNTPEALAVESTQVHRVSVGSSSRIMPDRMPSSPSRAAPAPQAVAPKGLPTKLPSQVVNRGPVPKSPDLPKADHLNVSDVYVPKSGRSDGLLQMKPEPISLRNLNRAQIYALLRHSRALPVPNREYKAEVNSRAIADHYRAALMPTPYKSFRTNYQLSLANVGKIPQPPAAIHYENMVKRIDSLFLGLDMGYARAVVGLWELAEAPINPRDLQARDALFAGIISERAGWETPASLLLAESASKGAYLEERYTQILWKELENIKNPSQVDFIVGQVSPYWAKEHAPEGDRANYAMAKRMISAVARPPLTPYPSVDLFRQRIRAEELRDRLSLLELVGKVRSKNETVRAEAEEGLRVLEARGHENVRHEARLALARRSLQKGDGLEAMAYYKNVEKNRKNRLSVLTEQTYAEYLSSEFQESLGKAVALQSPYFRYGFSPDATLVEILSRKAMCDFGGAEQAVKRFHDAYGRELNSMEATLAHAKSAPAYYEELVGYNQLAEPYRFQRYLLQLPPVMENQKTMNQALGDLANVDNVGIIYKLPSRPEGWNAFAASMKNRWNARAQILRVESAQAALGETSYLAKRLRETFAQVELLDLDISTSASRDFNLQSALNFPARKPAMAEADKEKLRWPFENEIWLDEIDYMKAKNPSKCANTATVSASR